MVDPGSKIHTEVTDAEKLQELEDQHEILSCSLISLTTHCAQVQFRLRQIVDASSAEKEELLKELEKFSFRGIPELKKRTINGIITTSKFDGGYLEEKILFQRANQKKMITQIKEELKTIKKYRNSTNYSGVTQQTNKSVTCKDVDDLGKLKVDPLRSPMPNHINQLADQLKTREMFVAQLKLQISDLERFVIFLHNKESPGNDRCSRCDEISLKMFKVSRKQIRTSCIKGAIVNIINTISRLFWMAVLTQVGNQSYISTIRENHWGHLRANLEIAVINIVEMVWSLCKSCNDGYVFDPEDDPEMVRSQELTLLVRNKLAPSIRDLMEHGLGSEGLMCYLRLGRRLHAWQLILLFYERKKGKLYNSSPAKKLSQSFNLDIEEGRTITIKDELLEIIGCISTSHAPYKRSLNSQFKAFICAALNSGRLAAWLRVILTCQKLVARHYQPWGYVAVTGFEDGLQSLERLTRCKFNLPVNLAVRHLRSMNDAF